MDLQKVNVNLIFELKEIYFFFWINFFLNIIYKYMIKKI